SILRLFGPNSGTGGPAIFLLPVPIDGVPLNSRISLRYRRASNNTPIDFGLLYYEDLDSDNTTIHPITAAPLGADAVLVMPNAVAWTDSNWFELFAGVGHEISLIGLAMSSPAANVDIEYDIGTGAAASETVITTLRSAVMGANGGTLWFVNFPSLFPVASNSRISVRIRKTGTNVTAHGIALLYYDNTNFSVATIIVNKLTVPSSDTTSFDFSAGGGLSPGTFSLANGESQ